MKLKMQGVGGTNVNKNIEEVEFDDDDIIGLK